MYANSIAIKAHRVRTAAHRLQALFTWAYAVDLGQGLGTLVADLVIEQPHVLQRGVGLQGLRCYGVKA